jgi:hypothetical protein
MRFCIVAVVVLAGCGVDKLTTEEQSDVADARFAILGNAVDGNGYGKVLRGVDRLIEIHRAKPDATYDGEGDDQPLREVLQDAASSLDGQHPDLAAEIDRALR